VELVFQVGRGEPHQVKFKYSKFLGFMSITVDYRKIHKTIYRSSMELVKTYDFTVGVDEQHHVRIEHRRKLMFAGFRPQDIYAYVDGRLVAQGVA
jgi:hypothetical protein